MLVEGVVRRELRELRIASVVAPLLAAVALIGCAAHIEVPFVPGDKLAGPAVVRSAPREFEYVDSLPHPARVITAEDTAYRTVALAFPSAGENGQAGNLVTARYYQSTSKGAKPLVIVLPIWGVHTYPSNTIAAGLRTHVGNINVLQIDGERPLLDWAAVSDTRTEAEFFEKLDQMIGRFVNTVIDIRRVVDWAETQTDVDPQRIALIGFSMGALVASVAMASEPRLAAGVLVMGGADPHEILAVCDHEIGRGREQVLEHLNWSFDKYRNELAKALAEINPARFAGMVDPRRVLIIEAAADTCVPQISRERLWQAMGRPERIAYLYDHRTAFLAMTFLGGNDLQQQIYRFLDKRFPLRAILLLRRPGQGRMAGPEGNRGRLVAGHLPCGGLGAVSGAQQITAQSRFRTCRWVEDGLAHLANEIGRKWMRMPTRSACDAAALATLTVFMISVAPRPGTAQTPAQDVTAAMQGQLSAQVVEGCSSELAQYCADITPGEGRLLGCLYAHGDKLSGQCDYALYDAAVRLEQAVGAVTYVATECRSELDTYCANIEAGNERVAQCLKNHASDLSPGCDQALTVVGVK